MYMQDKYTILAQFFNSIARLPAPALDALTEAFEEERVAKGDCIVQEGRICRKVYIIQTGFVRLFYYKDGKDITTRFANEGAYITVPDSFFEQRVSRHSIEAIEDCTLYAITFDRLERLYDAHPSTERIGRLLANQFLMILADRIASLQFQTAQERYDNMLANHSNILQRASLGHIASYLGITQETLSRIRSKK